MTRPFELDADRLDARIDEMVDVTFGDLQSQFLVLPKGTGFIDYAEFQGAYEVLKRETRAFANLTVHSAWKALQKDALAFVVLRTILGYSPPEWAELARSDRSSDVTHGSARSLDTKVRRQRTLFSGLGAVTARRARALVSVAVEHIARGAPPSAADTVHRLAKFDTTHGLSSVAHAARLHVPYAVLLYERYLGRPFASHRDSISEHIGDVMEGAVEEQLTRRRISYRKTRRAERIPGFAQAPDFFVPDEVAPSVIIEAKITGDDGTARDKVTRILRLASMRDERTRAGEPAFEVVACVDGRGFGVRRQDMRDMLRATNGKVFTLATLHKLVKHTSLNGFLPSSSIRTRGDSPRTRRKAPASVKSRRSKE